MPEYLNTWPYAYVVDDANDDLEMIGPIIAACRDLASRNTHEAEDTTKCKGHGRESRV